MEDEKWLAPAQAKINRRDAAGAVRDAVDAAVARQLVSDVPVGLFLSGGIDYLEHSGLGRNVEQQRTDQLSVGFDYDKGINELPKARRVAEALGLDHHELQVRGDAWKRYFGAGQGPR